MQTHPEDVQTIAGSLDYQSLLTLLNQAYNETLIDSEGLVSAAYLSVLATAPANELMDLAVDFALKQPDWELKTQADRVLATGFFKGYPSPELTQRAQGVLKSELSKVTGSSKDERLFAWSAGRAFAASGDDAGLDILLSDPAEFRNYSMRDG